MSCRYELYPPSRSLTRSPYMPCLRLCALSRSALALSPSLYLPISILSLSCCQYLTLSPPPLSPNWQQNVSHWQYSAGQAAHYLLGKGGAAQYLSPLTIFALLFAAIIHDAAHDGPLARSLARSRHDTTDKSQADRQTDTRTHTHDGPLARSLTDPRAHSHVYTRALIYALSLAHSLSH